MAGSELHGLVGAADRGDRSAKERLFATLYQELHRLARRELSRAGASVTISATTLIHEAYLSLAQREDVEFPDRARFLAYAARAMRGLIIDQARGRHALKRGGGLVITRLDTSLESEIADDQQLLRIGEALEELAAIDAALAELVDLKYFGGLSLIEIGTLRGLSERTMQREWEKARLFLFHVLGARAVP